MIDLFEGVLIADFWEPYESAYPGDRAYCLVDLFRETEKVDLRNDSTEWQAREHSFAERPIRPIVTLRKNSRTKRSNHRASTQAILMSVSPPPRVTVRGVASGVPSPAGMARE